MTISEEELALDAQIAELQKQLLQLKMDTKNLELAIKVLQERELIDNQYYHQ